MLLNFDAYYYDAWDNKYYDFCGSTYAMYSVQIKTKQKRQEIYLRYYYTRYKDIFIDLSVHFEF